MNGDIRDIKLPLDLPSSFLAVFVLFLVALAAILAWLAFRFFMKRKKKAPGVIALPPWETALAELRALQVENLPAAGKVKEYYSRLSDIVRRYIEERFSIRAPEMTTEEFLASMQKAPVLNVAQKLSLREFLLCSDMVKFARFHSSPEEMAKSFVAALRLVEETRPVTVIKGETPAKGADV